MNILNLPEWNVLEVQEGDYDYLVTAEPVEKTVICEECHSPHLYHHGWRYPVIYHLPMHYKRVGIRAKLRRYKCRACGHIGIQKAPNANIRRRATNVLIEFVEKHSLRYTFMQIGGETGLDDRTVRRIFKEYADRIKQENKFETPEWLGIDEIYMGRTYRLVLTNIKEKTIYGIYKSRVLGKVKEALKEIPECKKIKVVTMDMWDQYRKAVQKVLGHDVPIVADKFHVLRSANDAVEKCRKRLKISILRDDWDIEDMRVMEKRSILTTRKYKLNDRERSKLEKYTKAFPLLGAVYEAKEQFFDFYQSNDRQEAYERFFQWKLGLSKEIIPFFEPLLSKLSNWEQEVFNYFDYKVTNAFTESANNLIRHVERPGRGYSFEVLQTKILHTYGYKRVAKPKFDRKYDRNLSVLTDSLSSLQFEQPEIVNYGVPISTFFEGFGHGDF